MSSRSLCVHADDGTELAVTTWGDAAAPPVVLVHGLGLSIRSWGDVPKRLASQHRVVAYDLRGHAHSGRAGNGDYSIAAHARDLQAVLKATVDDAAVVVGNSLGGAIILAHARDWQSQRVAGAVLAGSGGSSITAPGLPVQNLPAWAEDGLRSSWLQVFRGVAVLGNWIRPITPISDWAVNRCAFKRQAPPDAVAQVREDFLATQPEVLARSTLASFSMDGSELATQLTVPTLIIHGSRDPEVSPEEVEHLLNELPNPQRKEIPDAGHMLGLTHPQVVADQVQRWVHQCLGQGK